MFLAGCKKKSADSGESSPASNFTNAFSVSATQKVYFSQGNLQYQLSTDIWRFAEHQWDYVGTQTPDHGGYFGGTVPGSDNALLGPNYEGWIDLFGWGTGNNPTGCIENVDDYVDWGVNAISNGGNTAGTWRTLTDDEWNYVFRERNTASGITTAHAVVNNVNGLILLPDNWDNSKYNLNASWPRDYNQNIISQSVWESKLEANGAVFLPAAGIRYPEVDYVRYPKVNCAGYEGRYWSSQKTGHNGAWGEVIFHDTFGTGNDDGLMAGRSVRLVRDAN